MTYVDPMERINWQKHFMRMLEPTEQQDKENYQWNFKRKLLGKGNYDFDSLSPYTKESIDNLDLDALPFNSRMYRGFIGANPSEELDADEAHPSTNWSGKQPISWPINIFGIVPNYGGKSYWRWQQDLLGNYALNKRLAEEQQKSLNSDPSSQEYFDHVVSQPDPQQYIQRKPSSTITEPSVYITANGISAYPSYVQGAIKRAQDDAELENLYNQYEKFIDYATENFGALD